MKENTSDTNVSVVPKEYRVYFALLVTCFALWGLLNNMTDNLVPSFAKIFMIKAVDSSLVQMAMMAYDKKDMNLADEVIKYDDVVDKLFCDIRGDLIKQLKDDTNDAECFIDMLMIDKYFERIGDHAVNIASWVAF